MIFPQKSILVKFWYEGKLYSLFRGHLHMQKYFYELNAHANLKYSEFFAFFSPLLLGYELPKFMEILISLLSGNYDLNLDQWHLYDDYP